MHKSQIELYINGKSICAQFVLGIEHNKKVCIFFIWSADLSGIAVHASHHEVYSEVGNQNTKESQYGEKMEKQRAEVPRIFILWS